MPQVYSGRDVGKVIEPLLRNASGRIWVCSPYISPEYARFLVYLIGGNTILYAIIALWIIGTLLLPLIIGGRILFFISLVIGFIVAVATYDINYGFIAYMVSAVLIAAYRFIVVYRYEARETHVNLLVVDSDRIVHSKIYIFDNIGITGSANLTKSGLWRNMETITIYKGREIDSVINEFMKIWNSITGGPLYVEHSPLNWMY